MVKSLRGRAAVFVAVLASAAVACSPATRDGARVVATTALLGSIVQSVAGPDVDVEVLMAPGEDPHTAALSARERRMLAEADLVVAIGLGLETGMTDALAAAAADGATVLEVGELLDPLPPPTDVDHEPDEDHGEAEHEDESTDEHGEDEHADEDAHGDDEHADDDAHGDDEHAHADGDPHVWLDPVRMARVPALVAEHLADVGVTDRGLEQRAADMQAEILSAHDEAVATLDPVSAADRRLVTDHEALRYFADRYGLTIAATVVVGTSSETAPSARHLARVADALAATSTRVIVVDAGSSDRLARVLAAEVGEHVNVVAAHVGSLGPAGSGADTYPGFVRTLARTIADALTEAR